jgi:hypothetical protein
MSTAPVPSAIQRVTHDGLGAVGGPQLMGAGPPLSR